MKGRIFSSFSCCAISFLKSIVKAKVPLKNSLFFHLLLLLATSMMCGPIFVLFLLCPWLCVGKMRAPLPLRPPPPRERGGGGDKHCLSASKIPLTSLSPPLLGKGGSEGTPRKKSFSFPAPKGGFGHHRRRAKKDNGMNVNASLDIPLFSLPVIKLAAAFDNLVSREEGAFPKKKVYPRPLTSPPPFRPNTLIQRGKRGKTSSAFRPQDPPLPPPFPPTPSNPTVGPGGKILVGQQKRILAGTLPPLPLLYFGQRKERGLFLSRGLLAFFMAVGMTWPAGSGGREKSFQDMPGINNKRKFE